MMTPTTIGYQMPTAFQHEPNDNILLRISSNDPDVAGLAVSSGTGREVLDMAGRAISNSLHLRSLSILQCMHEKMEWNTEQMTSFFMHLANNRSLEHLEIFVDHSVVDIFAILAPFFELNHKLRCIVTGGDGFPERIQSFISALQRSKTNRLEKIDIPSDDIRNHELTILINALNVKPGLNNLLELHLCGKTFECEICIEYGDLLKNPALGIQRLDLSRNEMDDMGFVYIVDALPKNRTLKSLDLSDQRPLTYESWELFSIFLRSPNCLLEYLWLGGNNHIDDYSARHLGDSFAINNTLKCLNFYDNYTISSVGWQHIAKCLPGSILEELDISECWIDDDGVLPLFVALSANTSLKKLYMLDMNRITVHGWNRSLPFLWNSGAPLEELYLDNNNINSIGASMVVDMVANMKNTVVCLQMDKIAVTADELSIFSDVMQTSSSSKLTDLRIGGFRRDRSSTVLHDDVIRGFATALANNTTLTYLEVSEINISSSGFSALADVLCNKTDGITSVLKSNHVLSDFDCNDLDQFPNRLSSLLSMNRNENKEEVVRQKIVVHYLSDMETSGHVFGSIPEATLPTAIGWIGRDRHGYSAMFCLVRNMILKC